MNERRGQWYLLTGLLIGVLLGALFSVVWFPVRYTDAEPSALTESARSEYRRLIAISYQGDGNLERAKLRLALLNDEDPARILAGQAQRVLAENGSAAEVRSLALLASALTGGPLVEPRGTGPLPTSTPTQATLEATAEETLAATEEVAQAVLTATPVFTPTATITPRPTFTPRPTATPLRVESNPFREVGRQEICDNSLLPGTLAVQVLDINDQPLAGARVTVTWNGEQSVFYTGFAPEMGAGYADFHMTPGVEYSVRVGEAGEKAEGLSMPACGGGWLMEFKEGG